MKKFKAKADRTDTYLNNIYIEKDIRNSLKNSLDDMDKKRKEFIENNKRNNEKEKI